METNIIDLHGRFLYSDTPLNVIVSVFPGATWSDTKNDFVFPKNPLPYWFNLGDILFDPPPPSLAKLQAEIRQGRKDLKPTMVSFTPSGSFTRRGAEWIQYHSGLIAFDVDHKDNAVRLENWEELKSEVSKIPHVAYFGRSLSGTGYWGLFAIPRSTAQQQHKAHFAAMQQDFSAMGIIIDGAPANVASLRFYSYDPDAYVNQYPETYTRLHVTPAPQQKPKEYRAVTDRMGETSQNIFEMFNQAQDICAMLEHYGWINPRKDGEGIRYTRPGKQSGKSAWALPSKNIAYIWTSSTALEPNKSYTPYTLYRKMEHGDDEKAAARALREMFNVGAR